MNISFSYWFLVPVAIALVVFGLWIAFKTNEYNDYARRRFRDDLVRAIVHSQPTWAQVLDMAETSEMSATTAYDISRQLLKDILIGSGKGIEPHQALIVSYIDSHKRSEPFEGLPNEIRVHLERLRDALAGKDHLLDPLTLQVRELVSVHHRETKTQKLYTTWGFFLGVIGLLFAAYTYFYPLVIAGKAASAPAVQAK